jgi:hypothetical protein
VSQPPYEPPNRPPPNQPPPPAGGWPRQPPPTPPPGPPGYYGAPLPGGPPKKSRVGLIIGLVIAGVIVIAGIVVLGLVVAGDDDSDRYDESSSESEDPTDEPTEETDDPEPDGEVLQGDGYSYELPDGWRDISDRVTRQGTSGSVDTASAPGQTIEDTRANLIVDAGPAGGITFADLETEYDQVRQDYGAVVGRRPGDARVHGKPDERRRRRRRPVRLRDRPRRQVLRDRIQPSGRQGEPGQGIRGDPRVLGLGVT